MKPESPAYSPSTRGSAGCVLQRKNTLLAVKITDFRGIIEGAGARLLEQSAPPTTATDGGRLHMGTTHSIIPFLFASREASRRG